MLGSGNDGPAAPDGDAPRRPDGVDPATLYDAPVIPRGMPVIPDVVDPGIPAVDASMTPGATPGEAAVASLGEMEGVILDETFPAHCGSVPASDNGVPVPDEESSSRRLSAISCNLLRI